MNPGFGHPIHPLTGTEEFTQPLGVKSAGVEITLRYDGNGARWLQPSYLPPSQGLTPIGQLGNLWWSSAHRALLGDLTSVFVSHRPNGETTTFAQLSAAAPFTAQAFTALAQTQDSLVYDDFDGYFLYRDQAKLSLEYYSSPSVLQSISTASGMVSNAVYSSQSTPPNVAPGPGYLLSMIDSFGRQVQFSYTTLTSGQVAVASLIGTDGQQTIFGYDVHGNLTSITWPDGMIKNFVYDSPNPGQAWALTGVIDEHLIGGALNRYATINYDSNGDAIQSFSGSAVDSYSVSYATPPSMQNRLALGLISGHYVTALNYHEYAPASGVVLQYPNGSNTTISSVRVSGDSSLPNQGVYYAAGSSQQSGSGCAASASSISYDANANVASEDDFNGNRTCYGYDMARNLQTSMLEGRSNANACSLVPSTTDPTHPERLTTTAWHPDWALKIQESEPLKLTTWVYNGQPDPFNGNAVAACAPSGAVLPDGKPIAVLCTRYEQATTDTTGASGLAAPVTGVLRQWGYTEKQFGQERTATTPKQFYTDTRSYTTSYTYYASTNLSGGVGYTMGDLASVTNQLNQTTNYTSYDAAGRLLSSTDPNGTITSQVYTKRGWIQSQTITPASGTPLTTLYGYYPTGLLQTVTLPDSTTLNYVYDNAHRLTDVTDGLGNRVHYTLDNSGNRTNEQISDASGKLAATVTRVFDNLNRVQSTTGAIQ